MNNAAILRQIARRGGNCLTELQWTFASQFFESLFARAFLHGTRYAMRHHQPGRDDVAVPGVNDAFDRLIEEIARDNFGFHDSLYDGRDIYILGRARTIDQ